jgi:hypothetical protein
MRPRDGRPATEPTEVRVAFSRDALLATLDRRIASNVLYIHRF